MGLSEFAGPPARTRSELRTARSGEVLNLVRRGEAQTTGELAARMGIARSTVAERVDGLLELGLLAISNPDEPRRGRPPAMLTFDSRAGLILAAQFGVSGLRVAASDLSGEVLHSRRIDREIALGPEIALERLEQDFHELLADAGASSGDVWGIGIGVPGRVELATAQSSGERGATRSWVGFPLAERLGETFHCPVIVDQDVNLLAVAEHRASYPDSNVFLCLKVGTVIGCGLVIDRRVVRGAHSLAGEIGHTKVPGSNAECACGNRGCLNAVAGGSALAAALAAQGYGTPSTRDVANLALDGNVAASQAIRQAGREIGEVMAGVVNLLNPDAISVWGYLADAGEQLFAGMRESIYRHAVPAATEDLRLVRARLGDDAGVHGATTSVMERVLSPDAIDELVRIRLAT